MRKYEIQYIPKIVEAETFNEAAKQAADPEIHAILPLEEVEQ